MSAAAAAAAPAPDQLKLLEFRTMPAVPSRTGLLAYKIVQAYRGGAQVIASRFNAEYITHTAPKPGNARDTYQVDPAKLSADRVHVFFSLRGKLCMGEGKLVERLEKEHFPPGSPSNDSYDIVHIQIDSETFIHCSFPADKRAVAERIARECGLTICTHANKTTETATARFVVPKSANILQFCERDMGADRLPPPVAKA